MHLFAKFGWLARRWNYCTTCSGGIIKRIHCGLPPLPSAQPPPPPHRTGFLLENRTLSVVLFAECNECDLHSPLNHTSVVDPIQHHAGLQLLPGCCCQTLAPARISTGTYLPQVKMRKTKFCPSGESISIDTRMATVWVFPDPVRYDL